MSKEQNRLTAKRIARLEKPGRYPDGYGLVLQIAKGGTKSWVLRYERHGREHWLGLGPLRVFGLKEARQRATEARQLLFSGIDPIQAKRERRTQKQVEAAKQANATTFREAALRYVAAHEDEWRNSEHRRQWRTTLEQFAFPVIGDMPVGLVDTNAVLRVLEPIWSTRAVTAGRLRGRIERVLDWARARGLREGENPARWRGHLDHLLQAPRGREVQHLAAMPFDEVADFMAELGATEGVAARALEDFMAELGATEGVAARALEVCILTATRPAR